MTGVANIIPNPAVSKIRAKAPGILLSEGRTSCLVYLNFDRSLGNFSIPNTKLDDKQISEIDSSVYPLKEEITLFFLCDRQHVWSYRVESESRLLSFQP